MKFRKWSLFITVMFVMSLVLAACSGDSKDSKKNDGKPAAEQTFNVNIKTEPPSLHPGKATDSQSGAVLYQAFEGLMRMNQDEKPEEAMAKSYEISDDKKTYTFHIREDAKWSNGDPVTAEDFASAWKWVLNPESPDTDYAYQLFSIKNAEAAKSGDIALDEVGITVKDEKTLVVELENPTPYFLELTAFYTYFPVNHNMADAKGEWAQNAGENYVSNGPFMLDTWKHKDKIILKKNPEYWDKDSVKLDTINMLMILEENTELQMYQNGELDWAGSPTSSLPLSALPALKESKELNVSPLNGTYYYAFNTKKAPFDNVNIRKAFALAIDRKGIVESVTKGEQIPATALVPSAIFKENKEGYFKDNDVKEAKKYLAAGLKELGLDKLPPVSISYNTEGQHASIAQAVQDMWKKNLGVKVELNNEEWNVYLNTLGEGDFQAARMGWNADYKDAVNFLEIFRTVGNNNYTNWEDPEFKKLIDSSKVETDGEKRSVMLHDAEKIFMDAMPISPMYYYTNVWLQQDYVKGIVVPSNGIAQYKWAYLAAH